MWAYDFVFEATDDGRKRTILTAEDEYTRQALVLEVGRRMNATTVAQTPLRLFSHYGTPPSVRCDNGPAFIAKALIRRLQQAGITCPHRPCKPIAERNQQAV